MNQFADEEIIAALRALPKAIRWTLLLVDVEGMEDTDAAKVVDVRSGTLTPRIHRSRAMLRQALAPAAARHHGFTSSAAEACERSDPRFWPHLAAPSRPSPEPFCAACQTRLVRPITTKPPLAIGSAGKD